MDWTLGLMGVCLIVTVPAYFFARFQAARALDESLRWRGIAAVETKGRPLAPDTWPALRATFLIEKGGTDEFGIVRQGRERWFSASGQQLQGPDTIAEGLDDRVRELAARVAGAREGREKGALEWECAEARDLLLCAVARGTGTLQGSVARIPSLIFWPYAPLLALFFLALYGVASRLGWTRASRLLERRMGQVTLLAVACGFAAMVLVWQYDVVVEGLRRTNHVLARLASSDVRSLAPSLNREVGLGLVAFVTLAGGILGLSAPGVAAFFGSLRSKPGVYAAIFPAMAGMVLLIFVPFLMGVYLAFLDNQGDFVGLRNFVEILAPGRASDTNFYFTLGVTVMWAVLNVGLHVTIGLLLALLLQDPRLRGRKAFRVLLVVPWAIPNYITALTWKWIFNTQYGPANAFLALLGLPAVDWLGRSFWTNFTANLVTNTWLGFPFMMVVSLGALQSIPRELYEAARIDGANRWQTFRHVTLPLLKPALFPAIILGTIWTFNMFNVVYLVSGGAPDNETNILITEAYRLFRVLKNYGLAAAYSLIIFAILATYTALTNRFVRAAESVYE